MGIENGKVKTVEENNYNGQRVGINGKEKALIIYIFTLTICIATIYGCVTYGWVKDGATEIDFNRDSYECERQTQRDYPIIIERAPSYKTDSITNCSGIYNNVYCTTTGGEVVQGEIISNDKLFYQRWAAKDSCLRASGWRKIEVSKSDRSR